MKMIWRVYCVVPGSAGREIRIPASSRQEAEQIARATYGAHSATVRGCDGPYTGLRSIEDAERRAGGT